MGTERSKRRRPRAEVLSPTAGTSGLDTALCGGLVLSVVGMVLLYGGTQFWASAPFWVLGLLVVSICQYLTLRVARREPISLSPPPGSGLWAFLCLYVFVRAMFFPRVPFQAWTEWMQLSAGLLFYISFSDLCNRRSVWKAVLGTFLLLVCLISMYALWLQVQGRAEVLWLPRPASYGMRASGTFICPNHFAQVIHLGILLAVILVSTPSAGVPLRLIAGYTLLPAVPALGLTLSRSGWLGLAAGLFTWFFCSALRRGWKRSVATLAALIVLAALTFSALWHLAPAFRERVQHAKTDIRIRAFWPDTWSMIEGEGFWGAGPGVYRHVFDRYREHFHDKLYIEYAHNEFLHLIAEYGWPIAALLIIGIVTILIRFLRAGLRCADPGRAMVPFAMLSLLVAVLVHAVFDFNLHITGSAMSLVLLLGCLDGRGLQLAVWKRKPLSPALSRWLPLPALLTSLILLATFPVLFIGSLAEYQLDAATIRQDEIAASRAASVLRRWTPFKARGWTELGFEERSKAFWMRDPVRRSDHIARSRQAYETALRWNPYDRIARAGLVELARMENDRETALAGLEELLRLAPYETEVRVQYGLALKHAGRLEESLAAFNVAAQRRPGNRQITLNQQHLRQLLRERSSPAETP